MPLNRRLALTLLGAVAFGVGSYLAPLSGPSVAQAQSPVTFRASSQITIGARNVAGPASPYPSTIEVAGVSGTITSTVVTLVGLSHTVAQDIDMLLVGPTGANVILMSDAIGAAVGVNLILSDSANGTIPKSPLLPNGTFGPLANGTFRPTNEGPNVGDDYRTDIWPAPAPPPTDATQLAVFNNTTPNGTWRLFVIDDAADDVGSLTSWTLTFTIAAAPPTTAPVRTQTPVPPPPPRTPPTLWLLVLADTQAYDESGSPLEWQALTGEYYRVLLQADGWAYTAYETDPPPDPAVLIWIDENVSLGEPH